MPSHLPAGTPPGRPGRGRPAACHGRRRAARAARRAGRRPPMGPAGTPPRLARAFAKTHDPSETIQQTLKARVKAAQTFSAWHSETLQTFSQNSTAFKSHAAQPPDVPLLFGASRLIGRRGCCRRHAAGPMTTCEVADLPSPSGWVSTLQILHCLGPGWCTRLRSRSSRFRSGTPAVSGAGCGCRLLHIAPCSARVECAFPIKSH